MLPYPIKPHDKPHPAIWKKHQAEWSTCGRACFCGDCEEQSVWDWCTRGEVGHVSGRVTQAVFLLQVCFVGLVEGSRLGLSHHSSHAAWWLPCRLILSVLAEKRQEQTKIFQCPVKTAGVEQYASFGSTCECEQAFLFSFLGASQYFCDFSNGSAFILKQGLYFSIWGNKHTSTCTHRISVTWNIFCPLVLWQETAGSAHWSITLCPTATISPIQQALSLPRRRPKSSPISSFPFILFS